MVNSIEFNLAENPEHPERGFINAIQELSGAHQLLLAPFLVLSCRPALHLTYWHGDLPALPGPDLLRSTKLKGGMAQTTDVRYPVLHRLGHPPFYCALTCLNTQGRYFWVVPLFLFSL